MNERPSISEASPQSSLRFTARNAVLGAVGLACLTIGYTLLAGGSTTAAPLLLVLGYIVLIPAALIA